MKEFPPFRLDADDHSLWRGEERVHLTPKAFAILRYLVERAGRLVTQNELLEAHWPDTFVQPEVLKSQILDIRNALGDRPKDPLFIETVPRRGYRFIAAVRDAGMAEPAAIERTQATLIGRENALEELRACLARAARGERQVVFVTGEQGMGKTTLVEAFLEESRAGAVQIARGQCLEGFGGVKEPYYPVLEALGQLSRGAWRESLGGVLEAHAPTWLIQLPALVKREHRETLQRELLGATRERMIREMCEALESLTEESTLGLLFEDLHWADHATVDLIASIAHRRTPAKLVLIGTYRPVDLVLTQHPLKQVSHRLKAHRLSREIALSPFEEAEVAAYLSRQGSCAEVLAQWIRRQTDGNPLFLVTIVDHLVELGHLALNGNEWTVTTPLDQLNVAVPDTLRHMIELEIEKLSPREQLTLDAASVQGIAFSTVVTASALETDPDSVEDTCQKLALQHHIVRAAAVEQLADGTFSQRYEFVHAVFRGVCYHRLSAARRAKLHRRFGEAIEATCRGDRAAIAAELAGHFEQCADWPRVVEYLGLAAKNAWQRFDYREAMAILEQSLVAARKLPDAERLPAEPGILHSLAVLQHGLHDTERAIPTLEALAGRAALVGKPDVEARALAAMVTLKSTDGARDCEPVLERVRLLIAQHQDPLAREQSRAVWATLRITTFGWDATVAEEHAEAVARIQESGDRLAIASVLMDRAFVEWVSTHYATSVHYARESLPALLEAGRLVRYLQGRDLMATSLAFLGQFGASLDILDESIEDARKNEAPYRVAMPLLFKAWVHLEAMDYNGASEMCDEALPALAWPYLLDRWYIGTRLAASADLGLGKVDYALERFLRLRAAMDQRPVMLSWYWRIPMQLQIADAWLAKGDLAQAREEADRSIEITQSTADRTWQALAWELSARVAMLEGDNARAKSDIENGLAAIDGFDVPLASWRVHATAAELEPHHLAQCRSIIQQLAGSLESRPALRQVFLSAPLIARVIDEKAPDRLAAGSLQQ